jgi:hypothetical protein
MPILPRVEQKHEEDAYDESDAIRCFLATLIFCSAVPSYRSNRRSRSSQAAWEARKRCPCRAHRDYPLTPIPKWLGGACAGSSTDSRSNGWPKIIHRLPGTDFGTTDKSSVPVPVQTTLLLQ